MASPLKIQRDRFLAFAFAAADLLVETDSGGIVTYVAGATKRLFGRHESEMLGAPVNQLFGPAGEMVLAFVLRTLQTGDRLDPIPVPVVHADGSAHTVLLGACRLPGSAGVTYLTLSAIRGAGAATTGAAESMSTREPANDPLPPGQFSELATKAARKSREAGQTPELTLLDMDGLSELSERLGAERANGFLHGIGGYLRARSIGDAVARVGDEKYGLMHEANLDLKAITDEIEQIAREVDPARSGIAIQRASVKVDDGLSDQDLARAVAFTVKTMAETRASDLGISSTSGALARLVDETLVRVAEFRRTLTDGSLRHVFQPIVALDDRRLHHSELLVRFEEGKSPQDIIGFAEDMQIISELDIEICRAAVRLLLENASAAPLAVNISARSIENPSFIDTLAELLRRESPGDKLIFEITESAQLGNLATANRAIRHLRELGHRVCLDDFGAGAAGFSYLQALDVDFVKFDGRYVRQVLEDERSRMMLKAMANLCRDLGIETVGEMIETDAQAAMIQGLGIGFGQGYLFGKPASELPMIVCSHHSPRSVPPVTLAARRRGEREVWG